MWRPITKDQKNGHAVLLKFKDDIEVPGRPDVKQWNGIIFVGRNKLCDDGYDMNWNFAAPVGMGGFPDEWLEGWLPLPGAENLLAPHT